MRSISPWRPSPISPGAAQRQLSGGQPDLDKVSSQLEKTAEQARRAGEIVKRMRMMVDRGRAELRREKINDVIKEAVRLHQSDAALDGLHVVMDLAEDLPPVLADRVQIQQVVINLLRNAQEAISAAETPDVHISTALVEEPASVKVLAKRNSDGEVMISIGDSGPGIGEAELEAIFEPFVSGREGGLGVGLAICRSIVNAHGGRIWANNGPEGGAEFHFTLPTTGTP